MSTDNKSLITFDPKLPRLTQNELKVLDLLIEAAQAVAPIYEKQVNPEYPGANFYPHDISREEIEKAAKLDPEILSPYTIVEDKNGSLIATHYHQKYAKLLKPVADKLLEAAKTTENKDFAKRLEVQAKALLDGSYDKAQISWMSMKPYILDINIGPIERYDDKLLFTKTSYQAWVGVMDQETTKQINEYKELILTSRRVAIPKEKVDYYDKIQIRVDDVVMFSGQIARTKFIGVNLPNDVNLIEEYGSEITIFKQMNEARLTKEIVPAFDNVFSPNFKKIFTREDLESGSLNFNVFHELAHSYLRYRNAEGNLKDLFPIIDELSAYVLGIKMCGILLVKDVMTQHELESIMVAFMAKSFHMVLNEKNDLARMHYTMGYSIFLNYLLESGAIREANGISWPNFTKIFYALGELATILERLLSSGSREEVAAFIKQYSNLDSLQRFNGSR